ncbi:MAG: VCBS repeat-containing protein [Planctomycetes bacterium]|nr:VCBS repeat-containing protein [Planctomycetota bacterium]
MTAASLPAQVLPGLQFAELGKRHLPLADDATLAVALGDVDHDGDLDLVAGNIGQNRLYLNDGTGTFTEVTASRMPVDNDQTNSVVLGDVDGDGYLDLVLGNGGTSAQNRVYINDGTGTFTDETASRMPVYFDATSSVALGDIDGDGHLDLLVGNNGNPGQQNRLYLNDRTGRFLDATASRMPVDNDQTTSIVLGDVDGDADLDLLVGNIGQNRLYRNNGAGTFLDETTSRMPALWDVTVSMALGDVDGDGDLDLVVGNAGYPAQQNRLHLNDGTGTFIDVTASQMPVDSNMTYALVFFDLDGDLDLDLLIGNWGLNRIYENDGTGTFADVTSGLLPVIRSRTNSLALGDVDGDLALDFVAGNSGNPGQQNRLYLRERSGGFLDATASPLPGMTDYTYAVALGDVDGDLDLDLVVANRGQNWLYRNDGRGMLADVTDNQMPVDGDTTSSLAFGDVDGDGDLDLVIGNINSGQNRLYLNDGNGAFTDATASRMPADGDNTWSVALGDVDGDGDLDLVLGNWGQNKLYLNTGTGTFTDDTTSLMPVDNSATNAVVLGDVDGDLDLDLVIGNALAPRQNLLYLNDGSGTFTNVTATRLPADNDPTRSVALGDVDGDGDLDLVVENGSTAGAQNRLYLNYGNGTFTDATASRLPAFVDGSYSVALGDVDGDGDLDLVVGNSRITVGERNRLYLNDGAGTFTDATTRLPTSSLKTESIALGDLDGDLDLDLVVGNGWGDENRLYFNLLRQLDASLLPRVGHSHTLDIYARYGAPHLFDLAIPYASFAPASIPLPPHGTVGINPASSIAFTPMLIPHGTGGDALIVAMPNSTALVGVSLYWQAGLFQDPLTPHLTNVSRDRLR